MMKYILTCIFSLWLLCPDKAFAQTPYEKMRQRREAMQKEREQKKQERKGKGTKEETPQVQAAAPIADSGNTGNATKTKNIWIPDIMTDTVTVLTMDDTSFGEYRVCFRLPKVLENTEDKLSISYNDEEVASILIPGREGTFYGKAIRKDKPYQYFKVSVKDKNGRSIDKTVVVKNPTIKTPDLPFFYLPAPIPSASYIMPDQYWAKCNTYGDLDLKVRNALTHCKYKGLGYFYTPGGFCVATEVEQFDEETGKSKPEPARWAGHISYMQDEGNVIVNAFKSLFLPAKGYYRIIVFVFTNEAVLSRSSPLAPSYEDARKWPHVNMYSQLPAEIAATRILPGVKCNTLIYEYYQENGSAKPRFKNPSVLHNATAHLTGSGLLANIK